MCEINPVEQSDRERAAMWAKSNSRHAQAANMRRGACDTAPLVQLLAAHRIAERDRCSAIAEDRAPAVQCMSVEPVVSACLDIAAAIKEPQP